MRRIETLKSGSEMIGNRTRAKVIKNKVAPPFKEAEFDIIYGQGISKVGEIIDLAAKLDLIEKAGAWLHRGRGPHPGPRRRAQLSGGAPRGDGQAGSGDTRQRPQADDPAARKAAVAAGRAVDISAEDFDALKCPRA